MTNQPWNKGKSVGQKILNLFFHKHKWSEPIRQLCIGEVFNQHGEKIGGSKRLIKYQNCLTCPKQRIIYD